MLEQPVHESEECLSELEKARAHIKAAVQLLARAPSADLLTKNAIEIAAGEVSVHLDALIRRLDEVPTA
ncbi:hypothetical protein [Streptomyces sp. NPDC056227]|uniref:hypothetical protein n=1 Tax=Streptomyces sp. NPDC056227 TaxID=3345753 RepID=UPI0035DF6E63